MAGERRGGGTGLAGRVRDDQRHVGVGFVAERPLALQATMGDPHLAVIGREDNDRVTPDDDRHGSRGLGPC